MGADTLALRVRRMEDRFSADLSAEVGIPGAARRLLEGGKRLRARLLLASAVGDTPDETALSTAASAIELVHAASLMHDDVVDHSPVRRGAPALHTVVGTRLAVLCGSHVVHLALAGIRDLPLPARVRMTEAAADVARGQFAESTRSYDVTVSVAARNRIVALKTAALFAVATELGGMLSDADDQSCLQLREFGHAFGMLFQHADDVDDLLAPESVLGRPPGTDLREGVISLPLALGLESPMGDDVAAIVETRMTDDRALECCLGVLSAAGVWRQTLTIAEDSGARALSLWETFRHSPGFELGRALVCATLDRVRSRLEQVPSLEGQV